MTAGVEGCLITDLLFEIAEADCDRELIVDPVFGRFTYGDVAQQVTRMAYGLRHYGIGPGDLVVLQLPNWPPFLIDMIAHPALQACGGLPALRVVLCGGTSVPEQLLRDARTALPGTFTSPFWGMTECGGVTSCPIDAPEEKLYTTDGLPCGGMELKVVDAEGNTLPTGTDGELLARGPMVTRGCYRQPEPTAESYLADGYFRSGDQARLGINSWHRPIGIYWTRRDDHQSEGSIYG